jgi:hypothetical protein
MSGDHSRFTFDPWLDFSAVLMQQGRPLGDWDWNELVAALTRRMQADTLDTIGRAVVPRSTPEAFKIEANAGTLTIGPGRMYVDGILVENHGTEPVVWDTTLAERRGTTARSYTNQPYFPSPPALPEGGPHLVYLDAWQREITHVERPELVDVALGVDTTTRLQNAWQVKILPNVGNITCATPDAEVPGWGEATRVSAGRLTTDTGGPADQPNPCAIPVSGGYKGLENQLYRIEIHDAGGLGQATFKWSRDNASIVTRVLAIPALDQLVVERVGRDDVLRFSDGDWIEITDNQRELSGQSGILRQIRIGNGVDDATRTITLMTALPANTFPTDGQSNTNPGRHTRIRRWDQGGRIRNAAGTEIQNLDANNSTGAITVPAGNVQIFLESGILASFSLDPAMAGGQFRRGDYWVFAARAGTATIEELDHAPPRGAHHHYARLALVTFPAAETDCRVLWPPQFEHGGCDCTVCVTAEEHNAGSATLQMAIDKVKETGGTVCLGPGVYLLGDTLNIVNGSSVRVRGQGWMTMLLARETGDAITVRNVVGLTLENMAIMGSVRGEQGLAALIALRNTMMCNLSGLYLLGLGVGDNQSIGIGLSGYNFSGSIRDCTIVADHGIAGALGETAAWCFNVGLDIDDNLLFCTRTGIAFGRKTAHLIRTRIAANQIAGTRDGAIQMLGGVLSGSSVDVTGNLLLTRGAGITAGTSLTRINDNEVVPFGEASAGDGIVLSAGLEPSGIAHCQIIGNRVMWMNGNGIAIRTAVASAMIKQNTIRETGLGGIVMADKAVAGDLAVENNQLFGVRGGANEGKEPSAALRFYRVRRLDLVNNVVRGFASQVIAAPFRAGIELSAFHEARVAGNLVSDVAPAGGFGGFAAGIQIFPGFRQLEVTGNTVHRGEDPSVKLTAAQWVALLVGPNFDGVAEISETRAFGLAGQSVAWFIHGAFFLVDVAGAELGVQANVLTNDASIAPVVDIAGGSHLLSTCQFGDNRCEARNMATPSNIPVSVAARAVIASSNRIRGPKSPEQLAFVISCDLAFDKKNAACTLLGNITSGRITINNNDLTPDPWGHLNVIA